MAISQRHDVRCLVNHEADLVLGRTTSGTLELEEDSVGLRFRCELPDTQYARDYYTIIGRGDISQCSFSFSINKESQEWDENGVDDDGKKCVIRTLLNVTHLSDVSAVTYPAYEDTSVVARKLLSEFYIPTPPARVEDRFERVARVFREINN
jgi:Escherichia/Staphylococcus phage prohead protease